jgi:hypothetical protein
MMMITMIYEEELEEEQQIDIYEESKEKSVKPKKANPGTKSKSICSKCLYPEFSCQCLNVEKEEDEEN